MGKKDRRNKKKEDVSANAKDKTSKSDKPPTSAINKGNVKLAKVSTDCETLSSSVENGRHLENSSLTKDNEMPTLSCSEVQQNKSSPRQEPVKFAKRKINSNWERYDETETLEPYSDFLRGYDFNDVLMSSQGGAGSHFQFQDEKSWNEEMDAGKVGELFTLDCEDLSEALSCIPLNTLLSLDKEVFPKKVLRKLEDTAKRHASSYSPSRRSMEFLTNPVEGGDENSALLDKLFELVDIDPEKRKKNKLKTLSLPNQTVYHNLEFNLDSFKIPKMDSKEVSSSLEGDETDGTLVEVSTISNGVNEENSESQASILENQIVTDSVSNADDGKKHIIRNLDKQDLDNTIKNGQITNIPIVNKLFLDKDASDKSDLHSPSKVSTAVAVTDKEVSINIQDKEEDDLNTLLALSHPITEENIKVESANLTEKEELDSQKQTETNLKLFNNESTIESLEDWLDSVI